MAIMTVTFIVFMAITDIIPASFDHLPEKSIVKAFGQVRLPLTSISRAGLTTDER